MMNEILEYEEYTCDLSGKERPRLVPDILAKELIGIRRPLTIIARRELEKRGYFSTQPESREVIDEVVRALKEWMGLIDEQDERITDYDGWFRRYYQERIEGNIRIKKAKPWEEIAGKRRQQYEEKIFHQRNSADGNDLLKVTYERIIADAVFFGPLDRYYLVCKLGSDEELYGSKDGKNGLKRINPNSPVGSKKLDAVFKMIAAYLIKQRHTAEATGGLPGVPAGGNLANYINNTDLANWSESWKQLSKNKGEYFGKIVYKKNLIYENVKTPITSWNKVKICQEYLRDYDFKIVRESEFHGVPEGYTFYADWGIEEKKLVREKYYE